MLYWNRSLDPLWLTVTSDTRRVPGNAFGMAHRYLLVRDTDGEILGEFGSGESAVRMLELLGREEMRPLSNLSIVRVGSTAAEIVGTDSVTRIRTAGFPIFSPI